MLIDPVVVVFVLVTFAATLSAFAGLVAGILRRASGATLPEAILAGGRTAVAVLGVQAAVAGAVAGALAVVATSGGL